jgi:molybdopterin-biosynthesis enzyme MoeA-like protein
MKNVHCEICGAEIKTNAPNFYTMFGQPACCEKCMEELSKKQAAETSKKFHEAR